MSLILNLLKNCFCYDGFINNLNSEITINGKSYSIKNLLYENSTSFTYLILNNTNNLALLKKITCFTTDDVKLTLNEIDHYRIFNNDNLIRLIDFQITQEIEDDNDSIFRLSNNQTISLDYSNQSLKICYIILPYYPLGTLQNCITKQIINGELQWDDSQVLQVLMTLSNGIKYLHNRNPLEKISSPDTYSKIDIKFDDLSTLKNNSPLDPLDDSYNSATLSSSTNNELENNHYYIHMNLTPENIMIDNTQDSQLNAIISDLSTCIPTTMIRNTIDFKEWIEDRCNIFYKSPELLNKNINLISKKTDIWSFGCIIYQLLYGLSPFQREEQLKGASIVYSISTCKYSIPENIEIFKDVTIKNINELNEIIKKCIQLDPSKRPTIDEIIDDLEKIKNNNV
ncbi:hypothetical protein Kpol_1002p21 [Vanderwaltozyma polyspora DSM 70294]|uniref:non-specific serine/threonine protein kinase n=1 Tax=Vanderwaltozyma polyspora (strain ATCC 22028 / DSM 70294 / BCRC 21397 / CBS 2163 / NBRC 10782 / NRRL Y-8283 / UCD 57-17) TaxID=436907 RepID=A7TE53_VANPO|nr:uncharacterized protein Kpol_1002p21 [Vanderwaltozyma polyspora DSM 70294]EDO19375.1 hypothetical protein Kpol_1002p21 [Vanderwaltozyma polyspora DSM 70294]